MGKTYVQYDDPAVQYGSDAIHVGDIWVKTSLVETWDEFKKRTWATIARSKWADVFPKTYTWDGKEWVEIANAQEQAYQATRIEQTDRKIEMTATRVNFVEGKLESKITQTADAITMEVSRATAAEGTLGTRITQTADAITLCATVDGTRAAGLSKSVKTVGSYITIENKGITLASGGFIKCKADQIQIGTDASDTIKQALEDLDDLVDTAQSTADGAATAAATADGKAVSAASAAASAASAAATADGKAVAAKAAADAADAAAAAASSAAAKIVSGADGVKAKYCQLIENTGITINDTTLALTASGNMHIAAGGSLTIASANEGYPSVISMDCTGLSFASGGSISIYNTSGNNSVFIGSTGIHIASGGRFTLATNAGIYLQSGAEFIVDAPNFKVRETGDVIIAGSLYHHGSEVLTMESMHVGSTAPSDVSSGAIWIKPRVGAYVLYTGERVPINWLTTFTGSGRVAAPAATTYQYTFTFNYWIPMENEQWQELHGHMDAAAIQWTLTGDDGIIPEGGSTPATLNVYFPMLQIPFVRGPITYSHTINSTTWLGNGYYNNIKVNGESFGRSSVTGQWSHMWINGGGGAGSGAVPTVSQIELVAITSSGGWTQADVYVKD